MDARLRWAGVHNNDEKTEDYDADEYLQGSAPSLSDNAPQPNSNTDNLCDICWSEERELKSSLYLVGTPDFVRHVLIHALVCRQKMCSVPNKNWLNHTYF